MLEPLYAIEFIVQFALVVIWGGTALCANQIKYVTLGKGNFSFWRKMTVMGLWVGEALVLIWLITLGVIYLFLGWYFMMDRIVVISPLLVFPALNVFFSSWPELKRKERPSPQALISLMVPIQTMAAGAALAFYLIAFDVPALPDLKKAILYLGLLITFFAFIWLYQKQRIGTLLDQPSARSSLPIMRWVGWGVFIILVSLGWYIWSWNNSHLPPSLAMVNHATADFGGGRPFAAENSHHGLSQQTSGLGDQVISVTELTGPQTGEPDKRFILYAEKKKVQLASGQTIEAWTFNGQTPGPPLVVNKGDLVEVKLVNKNIEAGVTIHWHGVDVPNAEDGVAGMTQNAVFPGESHTYRFVVQETGTHWYHSHQLSSIQVHKGLFGPFVILPENDDLSGQTEEIILFAHEWNTPSGPVTALNLQDTLQRKKMQPGTKVRLRLINSSNNTKGFLLTGVPFKVEAIDGHNVNQPEDLTDHVLYIGGGGRYDVTFTMPENPVSLTLTDEQSQAAVVFSQDGLGKVGIPEDVKEFDPLAYGEPAPSPFSPTAPFDREFMMVLDQIYVGNYNGKTGQLWTINGEVFPHTPTFMVQEGDRVKTTIVNRTFADHPMHLHGHHVHVLSRNGKPVTGSPLVVDTLLVRPGEVYEIAFLADNPGLWMDHCHNLEHAVWGMTMHLAYENIISPFTIGEESGNFPE